MEIHIPIKTACDEILEEALPIINEIKLLFKTDKISGNTRMFISTTNVR